MSSETLNYQCPSCGGGLHFSGETGRLQCDFCDCDFTPQEIEAYYATPQGDTTASQGDATQQGGTPQSSTPASQSGTTASQGDAVDPQDPIARYLHRAKFATDETLGLVAYTCSSCGAKLMCDTTTAVTTCPYCSNPTIAPAQLGGALKPDYVIPFKKTKQQAIDALKAYYKGKKFLPKEFAEENHLQEIQGIYVPFWLYDGTASGHATFDAQNVRTWSDSRYMYTQTSKYSLERAGRMPFASVPADGSVKMPDAHMDAIEPFDYTDLVEFSLGYMPGYIADRFDVDSDECFGRIQARVAASLEAALANTATGYDTVNTKSCNSDVHTTHVSYALLPVWMLHTRFQEKDYLFAMNGQTGKVVGDLPVSKGKVAAWFFGLTAALSCVLCPLAVYMFM